MEKSLKQMVQEARDARIKSLFLGFLCFIGLVLIRLMYLQVHQQEHLHGASERNFLKTENIAPQRGNILDCNGRIVATNRPVFDMYWQGSGQSHLTLAHMELLQKIEKILGKPCDWRLVERVERGAKKMLMAEDVPFHMLCQLGEQCGEHPNIHIIHYAKRTYPYKEFASHLLGYLGRVEKNELSEGRYGLEKLCQDELKGELGYVQHIINSRGDKLEEKEHVNAKAGRDIMLNLDFEMQRIAQTLFEPDQAGAFVIMDPENGAIKASASFPNFDPNRFLYPITKEEWENSFNVNSPLLNRVINSVYPPASLFKLVTFAAGLEEHIIGHETEFDCRGYVKFCGRKYFCIRNWGHGPLSAKMSLGYSCNIPCFTIAKKIKIDQLAQYAARFGLGQSTKTIFPENSGLMPTTTWKKSIKGEPWWKGETLSASIGQSYILVTPLQIARMVSSIYTGYLVKPRYLFNEPIEQQPLSIAYSTRHFLQEGMRTAADEGSAQKLGFVKGFQVFAKTGTAQTSGMRKEKEKTTKQQFEHAWVAAYVRYKNMKPFTMVIIVEHAGSSRPALIVGEKFLRAYKEVLETASTPTTA